MPLARIALNYIQANYFKQTVVKHPDRAEAERFWNFFYAAIEEAVVNAVYHRSYEIREPIEVRISPDDLVVLSFPDRTVPSGWRTCEPVKRSAAATAIDGSAIS
jgi:ATP-dependent DNA helicase RecG